MQIEDPNTNSGEKTHFWNSMKQTEFKSIITQRTGEETTSFVREFQKDEWDRIIAPTLRYSMFRNKEIDANLTSLTYLNPELTTEEKNRRLSFLHEPTVIKTLDQLRRWKACPKPLSWHMDKDSDNLDEKIAKEEEKAARRRDELSGQIDATYKIEEIKRSHPPSLAPDFFEFHRKKEDIIKYMAIDPVFFRKAMELREEVQRKVSSLRQKLSQVNHRVDELKKSRAAIVERFRWQIQEAGHLEELRNIAAKKLARIEALQAKECHELFPLACSKPEPAKRPDLNAAILNALVERRAPASPENQVSQKETNGESFESTLGTRDGRIAKNPLGVRGVDAVQVSSHRGPPTDRPPDRPDAGLGVVRGCLQERADTPCSNQLASFSCLDHSMSGKATPFAANANILVRTPLYYQASSQTGTSHFVSRRVRSWVHTDAGRSTVNSFGLNLGRDLVRLPRTESAGSMAERYRVTRLPRVATCTAPGSGLRAKAKGANGTGKSQVVPEECEAGGTRVVAGSGQRDTRAANHRPPKT
jgi:hypothetical protein